MPGRAINRENHVLQQNPMNINAQCESLSSYKNRGLRIWKNKISQYINKKKLI
jgi:hypothetical protein